MQALALAYVVYDSAPEDLETRNLKFLYNAARQEVLRNQREATRDGMLKLHLKNLLGAPLPKAAAKSRFRTRNRTNVYEPLLLPAPTDGHVCVVGHAKVHS